MVNVCSGARLNGAPISNPTGNRPLVFDIGTVPALVDGNGNGTADPGEPGYMELIYQLVIGSGATPGKYRNTAIAKDFCPTCTVSNTRNPMVAVSPVSGPALRLHSKYQVGVYSTSGLQIVSLQRILVRRSLSRGCRGCPKMSQ